MTSGCEWLAVWSSCAASSGGGRLPATGTLRRDDDDSIRPAYTVDPGLRGILQHADRLDVVGIHAREGAARPGLDWRAVDDEQWLVAAVERRRPANANSDTAAACPADLDAGNLRFDDPLDRRTGTSIDVLRRDDRRGRGLREAPVVHARGRECQRDTERSVLARR